MNQNNIVELVFGLLDKEMANYKRFEENEKQEGNYNAAELMQMRYWNIHDVKQKIVSALSGKTVDEIVIGSTSYTLKQLQRYIKFYDDHQIRAGQMYCPLCESFYDENGVFVCDECGNLISLDDECKEHDHGRLRVCKDCCEECREQKAYEDEVNLAIDRKRGK